MLEGWSQERGRIQHDRTPISPVLLECLCELWGSLCKDSYEEALFHAAVLVAFWGAMWISELVALGKGDTSRKALQLEDVVVQEGQVKIRIWRSKTDQQSKGRHVILGQCSLCNICPVKAVREFMIIRGPEGGYFFQHRDGSPLTK